MTPAAGRRVRILDAHVRAARRTAGGLYPTTRPAEIASLCTGAQRAQIAGGPVAMGLERG